MKARSGTGRHSHRPPRAVTRSGGCPSAASLKSALVLLPDYLADRAEAVPVGHVEIP
jgi:hypothetical protein